MFTGGEPMDEDQIRDSLAVCQTYSNDGFFKVVVGEKREAAMHFLWVQARLAEIQASLAIRIEELIK